MMQLARTRVLAASLLFIGACDPSNNPNPSDDLSFVDTAPAVIPDDLSAPTQATFAVRHYDYTLDLQTSQSHARATLEILQPGNCITIDYRVPTIADVTFDGAPATSVSTNGAQLLACRAAGYWKVGDSPILATSAVLPMKKAPPLQVGFSTDKEATGNPFVYLLSWVGGCDLFGPCDASPGHFATYRFTVDHAAGTQVLCPGTITAGATRTTCDFTSAGGPTYSGFGLMASNDWTAAPLGTWGTVKVTLYDYPNTRIAASFDAIKGKDHFAWLQSLLGPYPYGDELRFVVGPTYWAGFEHPGNVALSENLALGASNYTNALQHVEMHEVTHHWAGNHATIAGTYDFAWKEAMAEYLTYVYEDEHIAPATGAQTAATWKLLAQRAHYYPVPTNSPPIARSYLDCYGSGPMILFRQLEVMYGRKPILDAIKSVIGTPSPRTLSVDEVQRALESTTGATLTNYFNAWLRGSKTPSWPHAKVGTLDKGNGTVAVTVDVSTDDAVARGCAFTVQLKDKTGLHYDLKVNLGPDGAPFIPTVVTPGFVVADWTVDPYHECLIWDALAPPQPLGPAPQPWRVVRMP